MSFVYGAIEVTPIIAIVVLASSTGNELRLNVAFDRDSPAIVVQTLSGEAVRNATVTAYQVEESDDMSLIDICAGIGPAVKRLRFVNGISQTDSSGKVFLASDQVIGPSVVVKVTGVSGYLSYCKKMELTSGSNNIAKLKGSADKIGRTGTRGVANRCLQSGVFNEASDCGLCSDLAHLSCLPPLRSCFDCCEVFPSCLCGKAIDSYCQRAARVVAKPARYPVSRYDTIEGWALGSDRIFH